jgi:hypothetical protein
MRLAQLCELQDRASEDLLSISMMATHSKANVLNFKRNIEANWLPKSHKPETPVGMFASRTVVLEFFAHRRLQCSELSNGPENSSLSPPFNPTFADSIQSAHPRRKTRSSDASLNFSVDLTATPARFSTKHPICFDSEFCKGYRWNWHRTSCQIKHRRPDWTN